MKLIDLNYHASNEYTNPLEVIRNHQPSLGYTELLSSSMQVEVVKHINYEGSIEVNKIHYQFFKSRNRFWHIPFKTHQYIVNQKPQIIIVQGFVFPLQVIFLRYRLGKDCTICLQHHGERPFKGLKGILQKMADRFVNAYSFASVDMATDWINAGVISSAKKCFEVMGVSTSFEREDKITARQKTGIFGDPCFLWVGRLNQNKDPLTVLNAFEKYLLINPLVRLYMIYQDNDMEQEINKLIQNNYRLKDGVRLIGKVSHENLSSWFSAADFYLSGSHREGSGYALIEAMACGCIPVVTDIPSFRKITNNGHCGLLYQPGNQYDLLTALSQLQQLDLLKESDKVLKQFKLNLSFEAYARQVQFMAESFDQTTAG